MVAGRGLPFGTRIVWSSRVRERQHSVTGLSFPPASLFSASKFLLVTFRVTRLLSQNPDFECLFILALKKMVSSVTFGKDHGGLIKN